MANQEPPDLAPRSRVELEPGQRPWWLYIMLAIIAAMALAIMFSDTYQEAFENILPGLKMTMYLTVGSFAAAIPLGLLVGLGRLSKWTAIRTPATIYIEFIRGVPMIVFIFAVAFVLTPELAGLVGMKTRSIPMSVRGGAGLCLFYAAFLAEVFRGGIQSVDRGSVEAGQAVGLNSFQVMRFVTLPQAVRNALPALGNDLIALMKDTSLVSILAVPELFQEARIYSGSSFRFREAFFILMVMYVTLTLGLSLLLRWYENRIAIPGRTA